MAKTLNKDIIIQLLFQIEIVGFINNNPLDKEIIKNFTNILIENFYPKNGLKIDQEKIIEIVFNTINNLTHIDKVIDKASKHWRIERMGAIDRAILRLGTYELLFTSTNFKIVINDAIEAAKRFGDEQSASFINGILDGIRKNNPLEDHNKI